VFTFAALASGNGRRLAPLVITAAVVIGLVTVTPGSAMLWAHLHGTREGGVIIGEDGSGLSVIKAGTQQAVVYVNGIGQSRMPYGDVHTALGALPAFVHPDPRSAVVIGLGSGDTVHAVAGRQALEHIASVEIIRGQIETLEAVRSRFAYPGLVTLLSDPRIVQVFADGRIHLQRGTRRYDIIEADALRPTSGYSGNLYSDAYFELVKRNLTPNGLAATWAPTQRVYNTFIKTFPHVVSAAGILLGSQQPIVLDRDAIAARLAEPFARDHFARAGIDIERLLDEALRGATAYGPDYPRTSLGEINTDLFPRDEFDLSPIAAP
jgi:spermidine synthase